VSTEVKTHFNKAIPFEAISGKYTFFRRKFKHKIFLSNRQKCLLLGS